ncbi:argininosuccinate lyase [Candidatus Alkanophaga liquidiphilum]|nr:Argininosuccinate lyase [Candidatus Alkanophaga liquidiphilum]
MEYLRSLEADEWLFRADVLVDKAHVVMLCEQGILSRQDAVTILNGLQEIEKGGIALIKLEEYEDLHTAIEATLIKLVGEAGGRMHTARSRNDEVATCIRLALRDELLKVLNALNELRRALLKLATAHTTTIMPGFTHLQHAQPTTLAHHLLAHFDALSRDFERLLDAYRRVNLCPLGAAAFAGTGFKVSRERVCELLGFDDVLENSMDAVSTRDFLLETLSAFAILMTDLSRLAEELILWSTPEFRFVRLSDKYTSFSSIMPQKQNPDFAELVRARCGTVLGCMMAAFAICKALPYSYNRDLQEVTPHLLRAVRTTLPSISVMRGMLESAEVNVEELQRKAAWGFTVATELADVIVRKTGMPFRTAHKIVGELSKKLGGEAADAVPDASTVLKVLDVLSLEIWGEKLSGRGLSAEDVHRALDLEENVRMRDVRGGPSPSEVERGLEERRKMLENDEKKVKLREAKVKRGFEELKGAVGNILAS